MQNINEPKRKLEVGDFFQSFSDFIRYFTIVYLFFEFTSRAIFEITKDDLLIFQSLNNNSDELKLLCFFSIIIPTLTSLVLLKIKQINPKNESFRSQLSILESDLKNCKKITLENCRTCNEKIFFQAEYCPKCGDNDPFNEKLFELEKNPKYFPFDINQIILLSGIVIFLWNAFERYSENEILKSIFSLLISIGFIFWYRQRVKKRTVLVFQIKENIIEK